jgi:hypothetical protein
MKGKNKKEQPALVRPPTYPARPINGGRFEQAEPLEGSWSYKPKWNGRRVLFHVPTGRTWNRYLEEVNYTRYPAFTRLKGLVGDRVDFEWLDLEFLWGRISLGKGAIIVLDCVRMGLSWRERQEQLWVLGLLGGSATELKVCQKPVDHGVYYGCPLMTNDPLKPWIEMQYKNAEWGVTFYEGLVAYEDKQPYPVQLFSPKRETRYWMKYRFID